MQHLTTDVEVGDLWMIKGFPQDILSMFSNAYS